MVKNQNKKRTQDNSEFARRGLTRTNRDILNRKVNELLESKYILVLKYFKT